MRAGLDPFSVLVVSIAGWMNRYQHDVIEYLIEENRVLRQHVGRRRLRFTDDQRRRLAAKAQKLGRKVLAEIATIVTPETLLAWHRKLIAKSTLAARTESRVDPIWPSRLSRSSFVWLRKTGTGVTCGYRVRWRIWATAWRAPPSQIS
jgi:hypothetical protein